ncbi:ribonuclease R [Hahella sp. CCB-MM4]|uniref:ribonuclease R n=1 Tax=Hahella sp. (strain CCB-MM4) TaxID=1926491 RepID=UPI000B9BE538|nr:ribonuclease R [Hahella sp. CCB-MM4]OZG72301.1 ribonuclease R [Hahella sp. CCB-MM4]
MAKKSQSFKDPHARREAERYDNPTASREAILAALEERGTPATIEELAHHFNIEQAEVFEGLRRRLIAMCRDGQLVCNRKGAYGIAKRMNLIRGRVQGHRDGYGFLIPEEGGEDLYLSSRQMRRVFDGDIVLVREDNRSFKGKKEAVIVEVVERRTDEIVGRFYQEGGVAFVVPDNPKLIQDVMVPEHAINGAQNGQYVTVRVVRQPESRSGPMGHVTEVLGDHMAPGMEIDVALRTYGIPFRWPDEVDREAEKFSTDIPEKDKAHRVDLRDLPLVTIDGEDARDFDDAVYCERKRGGGWRLFVAIADVSNYVLPGTALDKEAFERGNSVYFPNRVVPMLPEVLSNGLCSLNPHVERLCMVCEMTISAAGRLSGYKFYEAVMLSKARLTYSKVGAFIEGADSPEGLAFQERYGDLVPHIRELHNLYLALRQARDERGAIDFETVETRILFDAERKIDKIVPITRNDAHKLIEECMLCANVATARLFEKYEIPALYRVHEGPTSERLENLRAFLGELSLSLPGGMNPKPTDYQQLLEQIKERPDAATLQTVMLRSLSQAKYQPDNQGHFGLGYQAYTHFTSPIRRYPDLLVHRAIRDLVRSERPCKNVERVDGAKPLSKNARHDYDMAALVMLGEHCSMTERRADDATRDVMSWLKCEYLTQHVGDKFDGIVSAVTAFGLFVELKELYVEGLVHVSSLKSDYYHFDASRHRLVGERSGTTFRLGDEVKVQVVRVDLDDRKVDLELIGDPKRRPRPGDKGRFKGSSKRQQILAEWNADFEKQKKSTSGKPDFASSGSGKNAKGGKGKKAGAGAKSAKSAKPKSAGGARKKPSAKSRKRR